MGLAPRACARRARLSAAAAVLRLCRGVASLVIFATILSLALPGGAGRAASASADPPKGKRIALVIGIDAYQNAPHLNNPVSDARAVGEALRALDFDVTELFDPDARSMSRGIREFGIKAQDSDAAVIYYAGHGVQVDRENYLLPADARLERERDLLYEALPLNLLLGEVSQAGKIGVVLLDSCRNNPFVERMSRAMRQSGRPSGVSVGLAQVDSVPRNTLVAMATRADQVAEDGIDHSPFAAALIHHFQLPGLELGLFFRSVHDDVLAATGNRQEPYVFSALGAEPFYFHPRPPSRPPEIGPVRPLQVVDTAGPTLLGLPKPTDADQNPLTVRVTGLPRSGEVRIEGSLVKVNETMPVDRLMTATYKPDGHTLGDVGSVDVLIDDGLGNTIAANLPVTVLPSHHPAVVEVPRTLRVFPTSLRIVPPRSADGDRLTVVVRALPSGVIRNGETALKVGDKLQPGDLANLTFMPETGFVGSAGIFLYGVDNGRGDNVEGRIDIEVVASPDGSEPVSVAALWTGLRAHGSPADIEAFVRLFPSSHFVPEAKARLALLSILAPPILAPPHLAPPGVAAAPEPAPASVAPAPVPAPASAPPERVSPTPAMKPEPARPGTSAFNAVPLPPPAPPQVQPAPAQPPSGGPTAPAETTRGSSHIPSQPLPPPVAPAPASEHAQINGSAIQDCSACPVLSRIPAGAFVMGQGAREPEAQPPHRVAIRSFALARYPVTVGEWKACVAGGGCRSTPRLVSNDDRAPMHNTSWDDAMDYVGWLNRVTGHAYRLPSEAEFEYAARGGTASRYWWGDQVGISLANCADCGGPQNVHAPQPVDLYKPNPFGIVGALGGIAQWTADCWFPNYQGAPADGTAHDSKSCEKRVLRGGSFRSSHDDITVTARNNYDQSVRYLFDGFRVARDLN